MESIIILKNLPSPLFIKEGINIRDPYQRGNKGKITHLITRRPYILSGFIVG